MKKEGCTISEIHEHAGGEKMLISKEITETQSHIHFKCKSKNKDNVINILKNLSGL